MFVEGAPTIHRPEFPDFDVRETTETIVSSLKTHGCALLRRAAPVDRVEAYLTALDEIYRRYDESPSDFNGLEDNIEQGDVFHKTFNLFSEMKFIKLFDHPKITDVSDRVLGRLKSVTNGTFLSVSGGRKAIAGINLHTDGIIQGTKDFVLCFWMPLHPCGNDAAGLRVVPASKERVIDYLRSKFPGREIPGWSSSTEWADTNAFELASLRHEFSNVWNPVMNPGDVMLFTNWTIHGSNFTSEMHKRRSAAVLRLQRLTPHSVLKRAAAFARRKYAMSIKSRAQA